MNDGDPDSSNEPLRISSYDRASSLLIALLVLLGVVVGCLVLVWYGGQVLIAPAPVPVQLTELAGGSEFGVLGESLEIVAPTAEQIAQETDLEFPQFEETLAAAIDTLAAHQAELVDPLQSTSPNSGQAGGSQGTGNAPALGEGEGAGGLPRAQRWEVLLAEGRTLRQYAALLERFGIELGVVGATSQLVYVYDLASDKPRTRTGPRLDEQRMYMSYRGGALAEADRRLVAQAGVDASGKVIVQFLPAELENQLAHLEQQFAGRQPTDIRRTLFGVRGEGPRSRFYVIAQDVWEQ